MKAAQTRMFDPDRLDRVLLSISRPPAAGAADKFEKELAAFARRKYCLLTESGRAALKIGLKALGLKPGAAVGMTDLTHPSAPEAAEWAGLDPRFIDIRKDTLNLDACRLKTAAKDLDALIATHMFSTPADIRAALKLARNNGFPVLEDASQIIGGSLKGRPFGSFGDISVFSLSPSKPVSCPGAKAGVVLCDNPALFKKVKTAAAEFGRPGGEIAACLLIKLRTLGRTLDGIRTVNAAYRKGLARLPGLTMPRLDLSAQEFPIFTAKKEALSAFLTARGIPLEREYEPFHLLYRTGGAYPVSEFYAARAVHLPAYPMMLKSETDYVVKAVKDFFAGRKA
jgi:dTDP-4-amino-4,6-dideoxygalactose transaminase